MRELPRGTLLVGLTPINYLMPYLSFFPLLPSGLATTRDGYTVSLTSALRLPRFFASHSARPRPTYWMCGDLGIGWAHYSLLSLFWIIALAIKGVFDYFVLWRVSDVERLT